MCKENRRVLKYPYRDAGETDPSKRLQWIDGNAHYIRFPNALSDQQTTLVQYAIPNYRLRKL